MERIKNMKKIQFYYYCIYNMVYKDGWGLQDPQGSRAMPFEQRPLLLFTFGIWLWTFVIRLFLAKLIKIDYSILIIPNVEVLIIILCWGILYFYFVTNLGVILIPLYQ